jgi:8-oxo-dGTP pyrophosphatase MutT (NUDIX family)
MIQPWKKHEHKTEYDCGFFQVQVYSSASPKTGKQHPFYILSTRDWINIIAITREKKVLMVSQYRHGSEEVSLETPGGAIDAKDKQPLEAAQRELLEETGHQADEWHFLGKLRPNPAILNNTCFFYLALGCLSVGDLHLDEAEELEVSTHDLEEVREMIRKGEIQHSLVVGAFYFLDLYRKENPGKI